jgi:hypothetical protein
MHDMFKQIPRYNNGTIPNGTDKKVLDSHVGKILTRRNLRRRKCRLLLILPKESKDNSGI